MSAAPDAGWSADRQAKAFTGAGPGDWREVDGLVAAAGLWRGREQWEAQDWDVARGQPKTTAQARRALIARVGDPAAPDTDATVYGGPGPGRAIRGVAAPAAASGIFVPWLVDAARWAGLRVVTVPGWETRGQGGMRVVEGVVGHHTGTAQTAPGDYPSLRVVRDGRADLAGPLCNYGLGRDGTVYVVAAGTAYHAGASRWAGFVDLNDEFLGIEAESAGGGGWTAAQRDAYPRLVAGALFYMRRGVDRYVSHRGAALPAGRKPDPAGLTDEWMRSAAQAVLVGPATAAPVPAAASTPRVTSRRDTMITNYDLVPGNSGRRLIVPTGGGAVVTERAWLSLALNGPRSGRVRAWAQTATAGLADTGGWRDLAFRDGRSDVWSWELPAGTNQVSVQWELPDGGVLCVETLARK